MRNTLAAISVALELKLNEGSIKKALSGFEGVKRRFTKTGEVGGITVIDDYGHHPVEIAATLKAARSAVDQGAGAGRRVSGFEIAGSRNPKPETPSKLIAVVQPHRYTRVRDLFKEFCACFNDADTVIVADIYSAGEEPIEGITRDALVDGLRAGGHKHALALNAPEDLAGMVAEEAGEGDYVVCLGAGSITKWAYALPEELEKLIK